MAAVVSVAGGKHEALDAARLVLHGDGAAWLHYELRGAPAALRGLPSLLPGSYASSTAGAAAASSLTHTPTATVRAGDRVCVVLRGDGHGGSNGGASPHRIEGVVVRVTHGELVLTVVDKGVTWQRDSIVTLPTSTVAYVARLSDATAFGDGLDVDTPVAGGPSVAAAAAAAGLTVRCATADVTWTPAYVLTLGHDAAAGSVLDVAADVKNSGVAAVSTRSLVVTERSSGLHGASGGASQHYYAARAMSSQAAPAAFAFGGASAATLGTRGGGGGGEADDEAGGGAGSSQRGSGGETQASQADAEWTLAPGPTARVFAPGATTRVSVGQLRLSEGARFVCEVPADAPERVTSVTSVETVRRVLIEATHALGVLPAGRMLVFGADDTSSGGALLMHLGSTVAGVARLGRLAPGDGVHVDVGSAATLFKVTVERQPLIESAPAGGIVEQRRVVRVTAAWTGGAMSARPALEIWTRQWTNEAFGGIETPPGVAYERRRAPARAGLKEVDRQTIHVFVLRPAPGEPVTLEYTLVTRVNAGFGRTSRIGNAVPGYASVAL